MLKFKTKKSDEVKISPLTKKSNAVAKATMFFVTLIATMGDCSGRLIVSNTRSVTTL